MEVKIKALEDNVTREVVDLPPGKKAIGSKWVFKIKYKANGEVERFKARLVAKGYTQQDGLDYHETFSSVAKMVTVKTIISIAASKGWNLFQMDANNAFLQSDLYEEVYRCLPQGFHKQGEQKTLHSSFKVKDLGKLRYFLEIEVLRSNKGVLLTQRKYALQLISYVGLAAAKPINTLVELNQKLTTIDYDTHVGHAGDAKLQDHPKQSHWDAVVRVVRYVKGALGLGLLKELQVAVDVPVNLYCNSNAALQIAANPIFYERTKYIEIDCHFIREKIKVGLISPHYNPTSLQLADLMTKGLGSTQHYFFLSKLGVFDPFHPPA
uniref:Uncharacterized protein LOC104211510 n=1 Tax=Nicotiana sylvestris TaxID=4096 RepID=A0A1U7V1N5_NICSY|nr:PREDICTED: uncharacterized protein LOC104211510 [Nicotiana sylvestris]